MGKKEVNKTLGEEEKKVQKTENNEVQDIEEQETIVKDEQTIDVKNTEVEQVQKLASDELMKESLKTLENNDEEVNSPSLEDGLYKDIQTNICVNFGKSPGSRIQATKGLRYHFTPLANDDQEKVQVIIRAITDYLINNDMSRTDVISCGSKEWDDIDYKIMNGYDTLMNKLCDGIEEIDTTINDTVFMARVGDYINPDIAMLLKEVLSNK